MATIKSYSDLQQSKKLAEILPLESADYHYITQGENQYLYPYTLTPEQIKDYDKNIQYIPCWSVGSLLSIAPVEDIYITPNFDGKVVVIPEFKDEKGTYTSEDAYFTGETLVDACFNMVVWLLKNGYIKK